MLKKYSDYINENKHMKTSTIPETPKVQEPKIDILKIKKKEQKKKDVKETIVFTGKVVLFNDGKIKPSSTISLLENKNVSKDKLHYIITEQNDSIVLLKYNVETKFNVKTFVDTFIKYHKDNLNIQENIKVDGTDTYAILSNIHDSNVKSLMVKNLQNILK